MRPRPLLFSALVLAAGLVAYGLTRLALPPPAPAEAAEHGAQLEWLAREFKLTPAQTAEIVRLQAVYAPICAGHCAAIVRARKDLADSSLAPEARAAAEAELARLEHVCTEATRAHLQAVAAAMPPDQGPHFLALMEPRVSHPGGHTGAPALDGRP